MFSASSQCKYWMFRTEQELASLRQEANRKFIAKYGSHINEDRIYQHFLSPIEEKILCRQYESVLRDFCRKFHPAMPRSVVGTAFQYYKRFYLHNSVLDYHPKHIMVTCVYLACKVEEFNVSITQFVANLKGDRDKAMGIILNNELLLMQNLNYHLTVHNPFRPVEGFLIDIKTRCPHIGDPERFRPHIDDFLDRTFFTDACLLYAPSQIALAAVTYAGSRLQENIESYVTDVLLQNSPEDRIINLREAIQNIWQMVKSIESPQKDQLKAIEKKLEKCRNQENNPDSAVYKRKLQEMLMEEEDFEQMKYARLAEEERKREEALLGMSRISNSPG